LGASGCSGRIVIALLVAVLAIAGYFMGTHRVQNPITGETQRLSLTPNQEIALGLRAAPEMEQQYGGLEADPQAQDLVQRVGQRIVAQSEAGNTEYQFAFHLLSDASTVNAFALPGGQIFITDALYNRLTTEDELAGVLAHEVGHVVARHTSESIAKGQLTQGLTQAAVIAAADPHSAGGAQTAQMIQLVGAMINMKYSRSDELEADRLGVRLMSEAGYDPHALLSVMQILEQVDAGAPPEFLSTHPSPRNRLQEIRKAIEEYQSNAGT
jgi:predicted Zn-dependent protease